MPTVYRKSLKGIDEIAFKSGTLPLRLTSYLLAVDGVASTDELAARNPHLPSMDVILNGLMQQGFIELVVPEAAPAAPVVIPAAPHPVYAAAPMQPAAAPPPVPGLQLEPLKANMVRDVSSLLGSDAGPVITKIQNCRTRDDLFATMMGIKKIITLYVDKAAGDQFAMRYESLSS
jgi:hypothetical protein